MIIHSHKKTRVTNVNEKKPVEISKPKVEEVKLVEEEKPAIKRTTRKRVTYLDNNED